MLPCTLFFFSSQSINVLLFVDVLVYCGLGWLFRFSHIVILLFFSLTYMIVVFKLTFLILSMFFMAQSPMKVRIAVD